MGTFKYEANQENEMTDMIWVAEDPSQPGAAFAALVPDNSRRVSDAKTLDSWEKRGGIVRLVDRKTSADMLRAWIRPENRTPDMFKETT